MKTLIVYGSTYGHAQECAQLLKALLPGSVDVVDAPRALTFPVTEYDQVIIGGSIYMGKIQKAVNSFCAAHQDTLLEKRLALYLCCGIQENFQQSLEASFPEALRRHAASIESFGGRLTLEKMSFVHRTITKMMTKAADSGKTPPVQELPDNIRRMAEAMSA